MNAIIAYTSYMYREKELCEEFLDLEVINHEYDDKIKSMMVMLCGKQEIDS